MNGWMKKECMCQWVNEWTGVISSFHTLIHIIDYFTFTLIIKVLPMQLNKRATTGKSQLYPWSLTKEFEWRKFWPGVLVTSGSIHLDQRVRTPQTQTLFPRKQNTPQATATGNSVVLDMLQLHVTMCNNNNSIPKIWSRFFVCVFAL